MNVAQHSELNFKAIAANPFPFATTRRTFKRGEIITAYDTVEQNCYFLLKGIAQTAVRYKNKERILEFFFPGIFFTAYTSFLLQKPSVGQITAITDIEAETVSYETLQLAYSESIEVNHIGMVITEHYLALRSEREMDFLTLSAEERYDSLIQMRPEVVKEIPVFKIAQYLGIHPESLSRIRKGLK